jgi:GTPase
MTNAHDHFSLDSELDQTTGWDEDSVEPVDVDDETDEATDEGDDWESGYAEEGYDDGFDDRDPELTTGEQDLAERYALRRVQGLSTEL